ncbi:TPA-induced transmembrane protein isoform X1 [Hippoglossus hippoglossus]|uniref:TPA-induced transmembrane protein isoform X1 n=1 Tax=Hippoglossus hippoglossus TaxID=8267 RepID=UPI00148DFFFD|nr:TPA-induced transmembrane protein isoform X1 [Hippoglossus hippoglossus]
MDIPLKPLNHRNGSEGPFDPAHEPAAGNGDALLSGRAADEEMNEGTAYPNGEISTVCRIKREVERNVKPWMVIVTILVLIVAVIILSIVVCSALQEDVDDKFDSSLFEIPLRFNGSFQLPNMVFTEELLILSSNESQTLTAELQEKVADLYTASPALGRYFSKAKIYSLRNGSIIAYYQLTFLMPEEQQDQLRNFTLSREMVYNVFRQFLYDHESEDSAPTYIDPLSLNMFGRLW